MKQEREHTSALGLVARHTGGMCPLLVISPTAILREWANINIETEIHEKVTCGNHELLTDKSLLEK